LILVGGNKMTKEQFTKFGYTVEEAEKKVDEYNNLVATLNGVEEQIYGTYNVENLKRFGTGITFHPGEGFGVICYVADDKVHLNDGVSTTNDMEAFLLSRVLRKKPKEDDGTIIL
jgi:hypothetical protein